MDTRFFDMFHDTADNDILAVSHCVHIDFDRAGQVSVDKYRVFRRSLNHVCQVLLEILFIVHYFHGPAPEDIRRPYYEWIPYSAGHFDYFTVGMGNIIRGLVQAQSNKHFLESLAVFSAVYRVG
jgi:hypothetical protein